MAMAYKRVGTQKGFHHVRVEAEDIPGGKDCNCEEANAEMIAGEPPSGPETLCIKYPDANGLMIQTSLTLAAQRTVIIMAAIVSSQNGTGYYNIQRPFGNDLVIPPNVGQEHISAPFGGDGCDQPPYLWCLQACEEDLPAGDYTWSLVADGLTIYYAAWIKAIAVG